MLNPFEQFNAIVQALQVTPLRYAVVGGVATAIYGGGMPPNVSAANIRAFLEAARE